MYQDTCYDDDVNYYESQYNALDNLNEQTQKLDKGCNIFYKTVTMSNGLLKKKQYKLYTSGNTGSYIRDAETGEYTNYLVGSKDEDLFFKVNETTGKCKSKNGSNTLFYLSPQHYVSHLSVHSKSNLVFSKIFDDNTVLSWEEKRCNRMNEMKIEKKPRVIVIK